MRANVPWLLALALAACGSQSTDSSPTTVEPSTSPEPEPEAEARTEPEPEPEPEDRRPPPPPSGEEAEPEPGPRHCRAVEDACSCAMECRWVTEGAEEATCMMACPQYANPDLRCHAREARCVPVGSTDAAAPDVTSVRERLEPSARAARACPGLPAGGATIELTFRPDGRVATVDGSAAGPARGCVERAFRQAMIDAHAPRPGGPLTIRYPVRPR